MTLTSSSFDSVSNIYLSDFFFFFLPLSCTHKSIGFLENTSCLLDGFIAVPVEPEFLSLALTRGCWVCGITGASSPLTGGSFQKSFECENALPSWSANENVFAVITLGDTMSYSLEAAAQNF